MNPTPITVTVGSIVELELTDRSGDKEHMIFEIVQDSLADFSRGYLGENTPLARAVMGERVDNIIPYLKDDLLSIKILAVSKSSNPPPAGAAEQRLARLAKAKRRVEDTNAVLFASSFSGKWGDYDPKSIPTDDEEQESSQDEE